MQLRGAMRRKRGETGGFLVGSSAVKYSLPFRRKHLMGESELCKLRLRVSHFIGLGTRMNISSSMYVLMWLCGDDRAGQNLALVDEYLNARFPAIFRYSRFPPLEFLSDKLSKWLYPSLIGQPSGGDEDNPLTTVKKA